MQGDWVNFNCCLSLQHQWGSGWAAPKNPIWLDAHHLDKTQYVLRYLSLSIWQMKWPPFMFVYLKPCAVKLLFHFPLIIIFCTFPFPFRLFFNVFFFASFSPTQVKRRAVTSLRHCMFVLSTRPVRGRAPSQPQATPPTLLSPWCCLPVCPVNTGSSVVWPCCCSSTTDVI